MLVMGVFGDETLLNIFILILYVPMVWTSLAIAVKRWHDRGKSGWWILVGMIPLIGPFWSLIELGFLEGDLGANEYGPATY